MQGLNYTVANSVEAAIALFGEAGGEARYIAGGTSIYDLMKLGIERPTRLIDVTRIPDFDTIGVSGEDLRFGAGALMADVAEAPDVRDNYPILAESLLSAASQQLRNMATVGGNLLQRTRCPYFRNGAGSSTVVGVYPCNKRDPGSGCSAQEGLDRTQAVLGTSPSCTAVSAGDWPVALAAMNATIETAGPHGARRIPISELYRPPGTTPEQEFNLVPGELITAILVPKVTNARTSAYYKIRDRESFAFALASAAVILEMEGSIVRSARIALGGVATMPWRATAAENSVVGVQLSHEVALNAGRQAFAEALPGRRNAFKLELGARVVAEALMVAAGRNA